MLANLVRSHLRDIKFTTTAISSLTASFHSSVHLGGKKKLPFDEYVKEKPVHVVFRSGDLEGLREVDLTEPLLEFRNSKELETADENVKRIFSLEFAPKRHTTYVLVNEALRKVQKHKVDNTSLEAAIARLTVQIRSYQYVCKAEPKAGYLKDRLKKLIEKRYKRFNQLRKIDRKRFEWLTEKLKVHFIPEVMTDFKSNYWVEMEELTRKYCEQIRISRLQALSKKLSAQQEEFLKEKAEKLKFIAEEEKALGLSSETSLEVESELTRPKPPPVQSTILRIARKANDTENAKLPLRPVDHPPVPYIKFK